MNFKELRIKTIDGHMLNYSAVMIHMDEELREKIHLLLAPCAPQKFYNAYAAAHYKKYGVEFIVK
jgi:hypothetical protein